MESVDNFDRNRWTTSNGIAGQHQMEWPDNIDRRPHTERITESVQQYFSGSTLVWESRTISSDSERPVELARTSTGGVVTAIGAEFRVRRIRISPKIRYTRWMNPNFTMTYPESRQSEYSGTLAIEPQKNQVEFLIGLTF
jgi:hypothetical protein